MEVEAGENALLFGEGLSPRYYAPGEALPQKHQLLIRFEDDSALAASVQMYGGAFAYPAGGFQNPYYLVAKEKPSPYTDAFDEADDPDGPHEENAMGEQPDEAGDADGVIDPDTVSEPHRIAAE